MRLRRRVRGHRPSGGYISPGYCRYYVGSEVGESSREPGESEVVTPGYCPTTACCPRGSIAAVTIDSDSDHLDHKHDA